MDVEDVMQPHVETCRRTASLAEVRRRLARSRERCVVVISGGDPRRPLGVLTPDRVKQTLREQGETPERVPAWRALPEKLRSCWPGDSVEAAAAIMRAFGVRALPVVDLDRGLVGLVTDRHLLARGAVRPELLASPALGEGPEILESA